MSKSRIHNLIIQFQHTTDDVHRVVVFLEDIYIFLCHHVDYLLILLVINIY